MSNQYLKLRRSSVPNKIPDTGSLDFGELALNTYDGLVFMKKSGSAGEEVISIGSGGGGTTNTGSFATTGSNTFRGSQTITGSNGRLIYTGTTSGAYPTLAEIHTNNDNVWLERFYNDTFSTSSAVMAYFSWNDGRFVFHNESTQSIGLQVNGFEAENGLLIYPDKVAFVNNVEVTGSLNVVGSITGSLFGTASWSLNTLNPFTFIATGSVTASVNIANDIFLIKSASVNFIRVTNNTTTIQNDIFLIKDLSNRTTFTISQSIVYFPTQSAVLSNAVASAGGIYFTSSSFYVGLED